MNEKKFFFNVWVPLITLLLIGVSFIIYSIVNGKLIESQGIKKIPVQEIEKVNSYGSKILIPFSRENIPTGKDVNLLYETDDVIFYESRDKTFSITIVKSYENNREEKTSMSQSIEELFFNDYDYRKPAIFIANNSYQRNVFIMAINTKSDKEYLYMFSSRYYRETEAILVLQRSFGCDMFLIKTFPPIEKKEKKDFNLTA